MKEKLRLLILKPGLMNRVFHQFGNFQAPMPRRFLQQSQSPLFVFYQGGRRPSKGSRTIEK